jgi:uncharacterized membrane protein HdeD (DUF308 family)
MSGETNGGNGSSIPHNHKAPTRSRLVRFWGGLVLIVLGSIQLTQGISDEQNTTLAIGVIVIIGGVGFEFIEFGRHLANKRRRIR